MLIAPPYIGLSQWVTGDWYGFFSRFLRGVHSVDGWTEWTRWTMVDSGGRGRPLLEAEQSFEDREFVADMAAGEGRFVTEEDFGSFQL